MIFACKSETDATLEVDPSEADAYGQPFNVGLIEVTQSTSEGKSKMRNGLRWLIYKLEQRQRKLHHATTLHNGWDIYSHGSGREQRRLLTLDIEAEQQKHHLATRLDDVISPDSDASSGGHRLMYRRSMGVNTVEGDEDHSDKRSSSSSLGWMMKSPLRVTTNTEDKPKFEPAPHVRIDAEVKDTPQRSVHLYPSICRLVLTCGQ